MCSDKKKALVICKESYTYPMNYIKDELKGRGYEVEAFFVHYTETILEDHSYRSFRERDSDAVIYTFNSAIKLFWDNYKNAEQFLDKQYLKYVEDTYCGDLPFGILLMSSQLFSTPYHYRFYLKDLTESEKLYWVQLVFKEVENVLEASRPSRIVDIDNSEFARSVLCQVAKVKKIPYSTLESSRYESIWLPTFTLGRETDQYFIRKYNEIFSSKSIKSKYVEMANSFRHQDKIMLSDYKYNSSAAKKSSAPFQKDAAKLLSRIRSLIVRWWRAPRIVGLFRRRPMISSLFHAVAFFIFWFIRERYLLSRNSQFFEDIDKSDTYVYFPLHLIPESTTLIKSPFYPNELAVIEAISKSLPVGWKLYVKEHGAMMGERPMKFYKSLKRLTNIKLVRMDCYDDPKPWIQNSVGVITLSGTSAFEAAMMGKPSLIFGSTLFELIEGVEKVVSFLELPEKISKMKEPLEDNTESCAAYLQTIHECGKYIPLTEIMVKTKKAMVQNEALSDEAKIIIGELSAMLIADVNA